MDEICCVEIIMENWSFVVLFCCFFEIVVMFLLLFWESEFVIFFYGSIIMNVVFCVILKYMDEFGLYNLIVGIVFYYVLIYFGIGKEL